MFSKWTILRLCLRITKQKCRKRDSPNGRFRFAVLDLDKAEAYPMNYVCVLPITPNVAAKTESIFVKTFGEISYELAQNLLRKSLKQESSYEVKREIERRIKLLEPKPELEKWCMKCGKLFQAKPTHGFKQKYCPECLMKRIRKK